MDIVVLAHACARRWYVVLTVAVLAVGYGLFQFSSAKPVFVATTQLVLVSASSQSADGTSATSSTPANDGAGAVTSAAPTPTTSSTAIPPNPLQNIQTTITALVARMSVTPTVISTSAGLAGLTVGPVAKGGPLIVVTTTGRSAAAVTEALSQGRAVVSEQLKALQDDVGAPALSRFLAVPLGADTPASSSYPSRVKALVVVIAVGVLAAILLAVLVDAVVVARSRRSTAPPRRARS